MALDEALLDAVAADPSMAVIRTYGWSIPTLSLGYFQGISEVEGDPRWSTVPVVRRPTGGGALWHDREVTYAVVIPNTHPAARPSRALYQTIHEAIAGQLRSRMIPATRRGNSNRSINSPVRPFLCFTDRDPEDIVCRDVKIVGSAQRRRSGAVLQHGSLLLGGSSITPELPGLADLFSISDEPGEWDNTLRVCLAQALGLSPEPDEFRPEEHQRAEKLRLEVYSNHSWTHRR